MGRYILTLDQGTTSSRSIIFDQNGKLLASAQEEFTQFYPQPGWVEHDPQEIWSSQLNTIRKVLQQSTIDPEDIHAIGITNQRETTVVWEKSTGLTLGNAIVWQDRRTATICDQLKHDGLELEFRAKTGLVLDAYFSGTKIKWILDQFDPDRSRALNGELMFGTIDTWLIWKLTGGKVHYSDYSNASRTLIFNIHDLDWDDELLEYLGIPRIMLPEVGPSSGHIGFVDAEIMDGNISISGVAGDQQAALFGQACSKPGMIKNTYGTGCFVLMNTGDKPMASENGLLTTIAWGIGSEVTYALEGSVFVAGAAIQWLRDGLNIIEEAKETEQIARSVEDSLGVVVVPAFTGLGAPHWDMYARGTILGITRGTTQAHLVRATLESIALQCEELIEAMSKDAGIGIQLLRVDGGASKNDFLMQYQSDVLNVEVERPVIFESTALGAALLAGLGSSFWQTKDLVRIWKKEQSFHPNMSPLDRGAILSRWKKAITKAKGWVDPQ